MSSDRQFVPLVLVAFAAGAMLLTSCRTLPEHPFVVDWPRMFDSAASAAQMHVRYACREQLIRDAAECDDLLLDRLQNGTPLEKELAAHVCSRTAIRRLRVAAIRYYCHMLSDDEYIPTFYDGYTESGGVQTADVPVVKVGGGKDAGFVRLHPAAVHLWNMGEAVAPIVRCYLTNNHVVVRSSAQWVLNQLEGDHESQDGIRDGPTDSSLQTGERDKSHE